MILFLKEHSDTIKTLLLGGGGFTAVSFSVDIFFKVLIGSATLYYLYLKIRKEKKDGNNTTKT